MPSVYLSGEIIFHISSQTKYKDVLFNDNIIYNNYIFELVLESFLINCYRHVHYDGPFVSSLLSFSSLVASSAVYYCESVHTSLMSTSLGRGGGGRPGEGGGGL